MGASFLNPRGGVDFFDAYNSTHGREAGDACLCRIAGVIAGRIKRSSDLVARYADAWFAVVLAGADVREDVLVAASSVAGAL